MVVVINRAHDPGNRKETTMHVAQSKKTRITEKGEAIMGDEPGLVLATGTSLGPI